MICGKGAQRLFRRKVLEESLPVNRTGGKQLAVHEFLSFPEPAAADVLPAQLTPASCAHRLQQLSARRLAFLAARDEAWWIENVRFFDVQRERIWIVWRRVLHTAHHRTQLTLYLRLLDQPVPSTYGPTADETWDGADPTT